MDFFVVHLQYQVMNPSWKTQAYTTPGRSAILVRFLYRLMMLSIFDFIKIFQIFVGYLISFIYL